MCYNTRLIRKQKELEDRFHAQFIAKYTPEDHYPGFTHPATPVIANTRPDIIQHFHWGLLPAWALDKGFARYTLNARLETLTEKPAFKTVVHNRCLILVDGFYEWHWLGGQHDPKQRYLIHLPDHGAFALAGLWSSWLDHATGEIRNTYTLVTTESQGLVREIHNSNPRMPIVLNAGNEHKWLAGGALKQFDMWEEKGLVATKIGHAITHSPLPHNYS